MKTYTSKKEAIQSFMDDGGFLLNLGEGVFAVCDESDAIHCFGRTAEHLAELNGYSEIPVDVYCSTCGYHSDSREAGMGAKHQWVDWREHCDIPDYDTEKDCDN